MTIRINKQDVLALIRGQLGKNERISVQHARWLLKELERVQAELREARRTAGDGGGHE